MSTKLLATINTIGVLGWLPVLPISLFFWEDAGNPLMLLTLIGIYGGAVLSVCAAVISFRNLRSGMGALTQTSKIILWFGTLASVGGIAFLVYLKNEVL